MILKLPALALIPLLAIAPAFAAEKTVTLSVPGMYCASCPFIVESAMGSVEGVKSVSADADIRQATVVFDDEITTLDAIMTSSLDAGYEALVIDSGS